MLNFIMLAILALSITLTYVEIKTGKITMFFFYFNLSSKYPLISSKPSKLACLTIS